MLISLEEKAFNVLFWIGRLLNVTNWYLHLVLFQHIFAKEYSTLKVFIIPVLKKGTIQISNPAMIGRLFKIGLNFVHQYDEVVFLLKLISLYKSFFDQIIVPYENQDWRYMHSAYIVGTYILVDKSIRLRHLFNLQSYSFMYVYLALKSILECIDVP